MQANLDLEAVCKSSLVSKAAYLGAGNADSHQQQWCRQSLSSSQPESPNNHNLAQLKVALDKQLQLAVQAFHTSTHLLRHECLDRSCHKRVLIAPALLLLQPANLQSLLANSLCSCLDGCCQIADGAKLDMLRLASCLTEEIRSAVSVHKNRTRTR